MEVLRGRAVHSTGPDTSIEVLNDVVIGYQAKKDGGRILFIGKPSEIESLSKKFGFEASVIQTLSDREFLMPGLVDTHIHAPQYVNTGIGYDKRLLDWLSTYTYPAEAKCKDVNYAKDVYTKAVKCLLRHGTTTACYFATIHLEASKELCRVVEKCGQRALVGKVNMDQNSPDFYIEETQQSLRDTKEFVEFVLDMKNPLIGPVITPRFPVSCSYDLLKGLGQLASEYDLPIQSHLCEQKDEITFIKKLFPEHQTVTHVFDDTGLLTNKTLMAHCVFMEDEELQTLQSRGVGISHCPTSNFNLRSGNFDARTIFEKEIKVGLGTDLSGGHTPSILSVMRSAIDTSRAVHFSKDDFKRGDVTDCSNAINHHHAFYMATLGGAKVLSMEDKIGNFEVGKQFDALLISLDAPSPANPVFDIFEPTDFNDVLMKFLYMGDDRNIIKRYVAGQEIEV